MTHARVRRKRWARASPVATGRAARSLGFMDAIALLKKDHATVKKLFKRLLDDREVDHARADQVFAKLREELAIHAEIEEQLLYPMLRRRVMDLEEDVLEALEEHHVAKTTLNELEKMSTEEERFEAKLTVLREYVMHHVKEEEETLFPRLRKALDKAELEDLGKRLAEAKKVAPTHPHPFAPDEPPANLFTGLMAAGYDRTRDLVMSVARLAWSMVPSRSSA
jgi:iron-sulfur cluster repair protein YtfE (RIC family)